MAEVATPSAIAMSTSNAGAQDKGKATPIQKPERPDEEAFKAELAKAEKDLKASQERLVCRMERNRADGERKATPAPRLIALIGKRADKTA